jgi:hypothetical protein
VDAWLVGPIAVLLILTALPGVEPPAGGLSVRLPSSAPLRSERTDALSGVPSGIERTEALPDRTSADPVSAPPPSGRPPAPAASSGASLASRAGSDTLVASFVSMPADVDVGTTVTLTGTAWGGAGPYEAFWSLQLGNITVGWSLRWTAPNVTRPVDVLFEVRDRTGESASVSATIHVVPAPFLEIASSGGLGDVGRPFLFAANLSGGAGPFRVDWSLSGGASNGSTVVPFDGTYELAVVPVAAGPVWVLGTVLDAWNRSFEGVTPIGRATALPTLAPAGVPFAEVGYATPVSIEVADGTPPFAWSVVPAPGVSAESPSQGSIPADGPISLLVTFDEAGSCVLPVSVVDASGVAVSTNVTVTVSAGLNLTVALGSSDPVAGAGVPVRATVSGGLPPFQYRLALSDDESSEGNLSDAGVVTWTAEPASAGYLTLRGSVTDATGRTANVSFTLYVAASGSLPAAPSGAPGSSASAGLLAGAVAGALLSLLGGFAIRRWVRWPRRRPVDGSADRAGRSAVRELLAGSEEGLDRSTLELLAEERHIPPDQLAAAVAAWQRAGRVRVDDEGDGHEVLRWVAASPSADPPTGTTPTTDAAEAG